MPSMSQLEDLCRREERICSALAFSLTDLAFALLWLAETEIARDDGDAYHASELIASAAKSHQAAMEFLDNSACQEDENRAGLLERAQQLARAINSADWRRRQATACAERGLRLVEGRNGGIN